MLEHKCLECEWLEFKWVNINCWNIKGGNTNCWTIKSGNINKFCEIRDTLSDILCLNIETNEIFHRFTEEFGNTFENVKILGKYNENIQKTFKVPVHLEALCAELLSLNATNSKK